MKSLASKMKDLPDITPVVRGIMKEQRITQLQLAKQLGWSQGTITKMLKKKIWTNAELVQMSRALKHDLLHYYYPTPPEPLVPISVLNAEKETTAALQTELSELKAELKTKDEELLILRTENALMREVLGKK
jgi:transcriptional regulator with XRE-family HTH domain